MGPTDKVRAVTRPRLYPLCPSDPPPQHGSDLPARRPIGRSGGVFTTVFAPYVARIGAEFVRASDRDLEDFVHDVFVAAVNGLGKDLSSLRDPRTIKAGCAR